MLGEPLPGGKCHAGLAQISLCVITCPSILMRSNNCCCVSLRVCRREQISPVSLKDCLPAPSSFCSKIYPTACKSGLYLLFLIVGRLSCGYLQCPGKS